MGYQNPQIEGHTIEKEKKTKWQIQIYNTTQYAENKQKWQHEPH